jgi:hypothetical protein
MKLIETIFLALETNFFGDAQISSVVLVQEDVSFRVSCQVPNM